jgi:hypothetical protein
VRTLAGALFVVAIAGCGGSSAAPKPDSPIDTVDAFIADVKAGDWKAACALTDAKARSVLALTLRVSSRREFDEFVRLKDCPRALATHADKVRARLDLAEPISSRTVPGGGEVRSLRGNWGVAAPRPPSTDWLIDDFPPP